MYNTTATAAATAPTANAAWLAALCARPRIAAPYMGKRCAPARSMAAACMAAGYSMAAMQGHLNRQGANALAGHKVIWPA